MGAFFLIHKASSINEAHVKLFYKKMGFSNPLTVNLADYRLLLYPKQLVVSKNFCKINENALYVCGSLFYKGLNYEKSLEQLLKDFSRDIISADDLYGNYICLFFDELSKRLTLVVDPAFAKNVYFNEKRKIISSNFLAIRESLDGYSLNQLAIIENLITGHLISPDTYVNEIKKIDKVNYREIETIFPDLRTAVFIPSAFDQIDNYNDALRHANEQISRFFAAAKNISNQFGAHIGLTGGFDSRLLLMHAKRHVGHLIANSFWRANSIEFENAKKVARSAKVAFFSFEHDPFQAPDEASMMEKAFYFFDGQIRSQNNWNEIFSLPEYAAKIAFNHFIGFHGCGGEQYRNADRMMGSLRFKTYVKHEWMFKQCDNVFKDRDFEEAVFENISTKIRRLTQITTPRIGLHEVKVIQNEVWNPANRLTRVNVLNQQQFYFAPFTEYQISHGAYNYVPYLGNSLSFQIELMKNCDLELSKVMTNYGFTIDKGEHVAFRLIPYIIGLVSRPVFYWLYRRIKNYQVIGDNLKKFEVTNSYLNKLGEIIDLDKLYQNKNLRSTVIAFDYYLNKANNGA